VAPHANSRFLAGANGFESIGRGFESLRARHYSKGSQAIYYSKSTPERLVFENFFTSVPHFAGWGSRYETGTRSALLQDGSVAMTDAADYPTVAPNRRQFRIAMVLISLDGQLNSNNCDPGSGIAPLQPGAWQ
jgi:hypothetical protein